jgi:pimeloyl-ACP methyl ester carboxylesterase
MPPIITEERIQTRAGHLAVRRMGSGPIAVLWHSLFVDGHSWDRVIDALSIDRTLVIVDGPGCGLSDPLLQRSSIAECAEAAVDLIDALGVEAVDFVGNAWGGHVGVELAAEHPSRIRSLIAISSPSQPVSAATRRQVGALLPAFRLLGLVGLIRMPVLQALLTDASRKQSAITGSVQDAIARPTRKSFAMTLRSFMLGRTDNSAELHKIQCPTLLVASDGWEEWTPEAMTAAAALIPNATTAVIPGARALAPLEQPEAVIPLVRQFWATTEQTL